MKQNSTERKCPDYLLTSCLIFTRSTMNICILNISTGENWQKGNIQGQWLRDEWSSLEAVMTLSLSLVVCGPYASSEQTTHIPQPSIILSSRKVSSLTVLSHTTVLVTQFTGFYWISFVFVFSVKQTVGIFLLKVCR